MYIIMTKHEFERNEDNLNQYDYVEIKEDSKTLGIYVPNEYAEGTKNFVDKLRKEEK